MAAFATREGSPPLAFVAGPLFQERPTGIPPTGGCSLQGEVDASGSHGAHGSGRETTRTGSAPCSFMAIRFASSVVAAKMAKSRS